MLGMYHCIIPELNHKKYYHILWDSNEKCYLCKYGRIGSTPQYMKYHKSSSEMQKFVNSKLRKGYKFVKGYEETVHKMNNAEDYIRSLATGLEDET